MLDKGAIQGLNIVVSSTDVVLIHLNESNMDAIKTSHGRKKQFGYHILQSSMKHNYLKVMRLQQLGVDHFMYFM